MATVSNGATITKTAETWNACFFHLIFQASLAFSQSFKAITPTEVLINLAIYKFGGKYQYIH